MILWNWWQMHKTEDPGYLRISGYKKIPRALVKEATEIWYSIYNGFIAKYGWGDTFLSIIKRHKAIALLKIKKGLTGDRTLNAIIKIQEIELKDLIEDAESGDFLEVKAAVEKEMGFRIDARTITVEDYHAYIEVLKKRRPNGRQ